MDRTFDEKINIDFVNDIKTNKKNMKTKNSILLYLCVVMGLCMTITSTQAQSSTHTGNITVSTQAEVDALRTTLAGKTIIVGDLIIGYESELSRSNITDLTPLSNIVHIKRNLIIRRNGQLVNLNGLHNLQTVTGGDFRLDYNDQLTTVDFPVLQTLAGYFEVSHNDRLTTLGNFPVLQTMGRYFRVWENDRLTTLGNFPVLRSISEHFSVFENDRLTTLGNFPVLTSIGLGFYNVYVPSLFRRLRKLSLNRVSLVVEYNSSLSDCYILREFLSGGVHAVRGEIYINNNATNGDCNSQNGIINSIYQGNITATTQAQVNALRDTLAGKTTIRGNLTIGYTDNGSTRSNITDLTPLRNIVRMTENLSIQQNGQLVNLNGLNNLQIIEGYFSVQNNDSLTILDFPALMSIGMNDSVNIPSEDRVTDSVSIVVEDNPRLFTCCVLTDFFLDGVNAVSGDIFINDNAMGCNSESDINVITLTLTSSDETIAYNDTDFIAIDFTVGCGATGWTSAITYSPANANFITLSSTGRTGQTGVITLMATPTANTGVERTATITLSTTGTASQTVVITQEVLPDYVYLGDITVSTQAAVNALSDTLAGKTRIRGNLIIGYEFGFSRSSITDLTPLSNITHIAGNLIIRRNRQLVNLNGLNNLQTITGGDFRVNYNNRLTTLDFPVLQTIEGSFEMNDNNQLTTLGNFPVLRSISEHFSVFENNRLTTLGNFPALQSISEHFSVFENNRLTTLGNFSVLMSIGVGYNVYVPTLVRNVPNVSVVVEYNPELPDDSVRSELMKFLPGGDFAVSGDIFINRIIKRTYLGDITVATQAAVNALRTTLISTDTIDGDLTIGYTDTGSTSDITDLTPLGNIVHITGNLIIQQNGQLVRQKSLTNLQTIGGYFSVSNNDRLIAFDFSKLQTIGGYFSVSNNARLTAFDFSKLQTIGGYFQMNDNARLTAFNFSKLQTIEGYFQVFQNANLSTLGNFSRLQTIEGYVNVSNHDALTTLGNFPVLDSIRGYFSVTNNDTLTSLGSFPALTSIGTGTVPSEGQSTEGVSILVENNPKLSNCSVLTNFLSGEFYAVNGKIFINANTIGCNSQSDINMSNISRVYISDITVRTQAELNALRATLKNIDTIEGSVTIGYYHHGNPSSDITDLTPLRNIAHITGNLYVFRNHQLVDLSPLTNLQTVGGEFDIVRNTKITTLDFPVLKTTGGRLFRVPADDKTTGGRLFRIVDNSRVTTLNFPVLDSIRGHVQILQSAHLNFPALEIIEGNFQAAGDNTLNFPVLQTIEGYLAVQHSDTLTTLDFPVLQTVEGFFQVNYNDRLTTLNFPVLQTIGRYFQVNDNHKLTTLGVFPALEIIEESFIVRQNSRLTTLGNFPVLTSIGEHLTTLSVSVRVENNSSLSDCSILTEFLSGRVHAVKGSIYIRNNATDGGCNSQSDILSTVYRKDITVSTQAEVNALRTTLTNIDSIDGNLTIGYTDDSSTRSDITDLTPLTNIVHITENLIIQQNGQLVNLNALNNLQTIGESFRVRNNDILTTLGNFPALTSIGIDTEGISIMVDVNPMLSTCCVLTDFFLDEVNAVSGSISITGNAMGCNSEFQINATTLTLTSSNESIAYNDTDSIAIDFTVGCGATGWTSAITYTPANANFITLSSTGDANQIGVITLMAAPTANTGAARTATITLSTTGGTDTVSQTVVITQAETPHTLTLTSRNMTIAHDATTASDIIFNVGGGATGWRSFITYTPSGANFITLAPVMNVAQTGEVTVRTTLTGINTGVERTATITLTTTGIGTPVIQRIVITQQSPPTIMLSTSNQTIAHNFTDLIDISFTVGGGATGWRSAITYTPADANFIALSPTDGTDITRAITIMATPMENMGNERSATITLITIGQLGDSVTAAVAITQAGAPGAPTLEIIPPSGIRDTVAHTATTASDSVEIVFTVGGGALGWTSMISYGEGVDEFITLSDRSNVAQTGEVRIKAAVTKNGEVDRSATITLSTTGQRANFSAATSAITITQLAPVVAGPPSLMVNTFEDTTINHETGALAITFTLGGTAKGWTGTVMGDGFITLNPAMSTLDTGQEVTIMATYGANMAIYGRVNTRVERKDNIVFTTTGDVSDTVVITQKAIPVYTGDVVVDNNGRSADGSSGDLPNGSSIDFTNITTIDGNLTIGTNARNVNLSALSGVTKITKNIRMLDNTAITNLSALSSLDTLGGRLIVRRNTSLTTLGTLGSLTTIEERLFISENEKLTTLGSFPALQSIAGFFRVDKNPDLTSLGSFPSLTSIGITNTTSIRVTGNAMLSSCNLLTEFLPGGMYDVSPGVITLGIDPDDGSLNNAEGCRTVMEITDAAAAVPHTITLITPTGNTTIDHDVVVAQTISFNVGGGATGWTSAITGDNFITLNPAMNDAQTGGVMVMATPTTVNMGPDDRSATITFTTMGGTATAATFAITITQLAPVVAAPPTLLLTSPPTVTLDHDVVTAQTIRFTVGDATGWTSAITGDNFITLNPAMNDAQTGGVTVMATPSGANTGVERSAVITFTTTGGTGAAATATVTITQAAAPPTLTLPPGGDMVALAHNNDATTSSNIMFTVGGGASGWSSSITYTPAGANFITLDSDMNTDQRDVVVVEATPTGANTGVERSAVITFTSIGGTGAAATATVTITQAAAPPTLVLTSPLTVMLAHNVVVAQTIRFTVGGSASGWTSAITGDNFITLNPAMNDAQRGVITVMATPTANTGVERSAMITFTTSGGTGDVATATVTITQSAAPPTLVLTSPSTVTLAHNVVVAQTIRFTVGGSASGWTSAITGDNFITLSEDDGNERGAVVVTADLTGANTGVERSAMITFTTSGGTGAAATATVTITQSAAPPTLVLTSPSTVTLAHDVVVAQTVTFTVGGSASGWTSAVTGDNFITLSEDDGNERGAVTVTADLTGANTGVATRSAVITFTTEGGTGAAATATVTITQGVAGAPTLLLTSLFAVTLDHDVVTAQTITFTVGGSASGWTSAITGDNFITLNPAMNDAQTGGVTVMATPSGANTGVERSAMITFTTSGGTGDAATATVTITQSAAPPTLTLPPGGDMVALAHNNDATTSSNIMFTVGGGATGWSSSITYTPAGANFITLNPAMNDAQRGGVTVTATPSGANTGVERSAVITFTSIGGTGAAATATVTITQEAAPPTLVLTSPLTVMLAHNVVVAQTIRFTVGGSASGWTSAITGDNFITLNPAMNDAQRGVITVVATPTANTGVERSAMITFTTSGGTGDVATATVTITQSAAPPTLVLTSPSTVTLAHNVVVAQTIRFTVGGSASGWTSAITGDNFITLSEDDGNERGAVVVTATLSGANTGVERSAMITFTTSGGTGAAATATVTITQSAAPPTLVLTSPSTVTLAHDVVVAQTITFTVGGSASGWTSAITGDNFITLSEDGNETGAVVVTAILTGANTGVATRSAVITFTTEGGTGAAATATVTITQGVAGAPTLLFTSPFAVMLDHDVVMAQTITFTVGDATGWTSAITGDNFITLSEDDGNVIGAVTVTADIAGANTGVERSAMITFTTTGGTGDAATATVTITQSAAPPTLTLPPGGDMVALAHNNDATTSSNIMFTVGGGATGWSSSITYTPAGANFITLDSDMNTDQRDVVVVEATPTGANTGVERRAVITFTSIGGTGTATAMVTIIQEAVPTLSVDISSFSLGHDEGDAQNIVVSVGGSATGWTARSDSAFVDITTSNGGNGDSATFTLSSNDTGSERTAEIVITTDGSIGSDSAVIVMITQSAEPAPGTHTLFLTSDATVTLAHGATTAENITFTLGSGAEGWTATSTDESFIMVPSSGTTGVIMVTVVGTSTDSRTSDIEITTTGSTGIPVTKKVTITQSAEPAVSSGLTLISDSTDTLAHGAGSTSVIEFSVANATWTVASSETFVTLDMSGGNAGDNLMVTATAEANAGAERVATITITATDGTTTLTKTVTLTQSASPTSPALTLISGSTDTLAHGAGSTSVIEFSVANATWTVASSETFVTLDMSGGNAGDNLMVTATAEANAGAERVATITITATDGTTTLTKTVTLTQSASPTSPALTLISGSTDILAHGAGSTSVIEFSVANATWTVASSETFVTLDMSGGNAGDNLMVTATAEANAGAERVATITITATDGTTTLTETVTLRQEAVPAPALTLSSGNTDTLAHGAGSTSTIEFSVANANWTVESDEDFVMLSPESGNDVTTEESIMVTATAEANTGAERMATITITATDGTTTLTETVTITQAAAPTIMLTSHTDGENIAIAYDNTDPITIGFTLGGSAKGWGSAITYTGTETNFIDLSLTEGTDPTEMITITATPIENMDVERSATIIFMTTGHLGDSETAEVIITQREAPGAPTLEIIPPSGVRNTVAYTATTTLDSVEIVFTIENATGWASMISYGSGDDFITLSDRSNADQTGEVRIKAAVTENEGMERSATITLNTTGQRADFSAATREITIIQRGAPPTFMLISHTDGDSIAITYDDINPITISFTFGGSDASSMSTISYMPENANFITLEPENNNEGTRSITLTPSVNTSTGARTATITLRTTGHEGTPDSVSLTITQTAAPNIILRFLPNGYIYSIAHDNTVSRSISFTLGGSATSSMSSISYVPENANFITLEPENNDEETRTITFTPSANTTAEPRTATITLRTTGHEGTPDSVSLAIMQGAIPVLNKLIPDDITIAHDATDPIPIFTVGGSAKGWRSTITYGSRDVDFITLSPTEGTEITTAITIMATPTVNTGDERTATITLRTTGHEGTPVRRTLTITQAAAPTIMLTSHTDGDNIPIAHNNTDPITISFTLGGSAFSSMSSISYMPESTDFITLEPENNDEETKTITITPSVNEDTIPRTATITLRTTGHEGTPDSVSLTITQDGAEPPLGVAPSKPFTLYPNPTKGTLTIEGVTGYLQMYIYDLVGREVMAYSLTPSKKTIDVSDLPSGMYVVTLQGEGKTWTEVLMKR